jgi:hypothetical protein
MMPLLTRANELSRRVRVNVSTTVLSSAVTYTFMATSILLADAPVCRIFIDHDPGANINFFPNRSLQGLAPHICDYTATDFPTALDGDEDRGFLGTPPTLV